MRVLLNDMCTIAQSHLSLRKKSSSLIGLFSAYLLVVWLLHLQNNLMACPKDLEGHTFWQRVTMSPSAVGLLEWDRQPVSITGVQMFQPKQFQKASSVHRWAKWRASQCGAANTCHWSPTVARASNPCSCTKEHGLNLSPGPTWNMAMETYGNSKMLGKGLGIFLAFFLENLLWRILSLSESLL